MVAVQLLSDGATACLMHFRYNGTGCYVVFPVLFAVYIDGN